MTTNNNIWKIAGEGPNTQTPPKGPMYTFIVILCFLASLAMFILGLVLIFAPNIQSDDKALAIVSVLSIAGIIYIFAVATRTTKRTLRVLISGILLILGAAAILIMQRFFVVSLELACAIVGIVISLFMFVNVWREKKDGVPYVGSIIWGVIYLAISLSIFFVPQGTRILSILIGLYIVMISFNILFESFAALFHIKPHLKKNFIVPLPMFVAACLPMALFREVNTMVKEEPDELLYLQEPDRGKEPDLIVYVHSRAGLIPGFGHCDLCYKGKVYAYGDYDSNAWKLGGFIADGTMAVSSPDNHIKMSLKDEKKVLMAYGIQTNEEVNKKIEAKINEIMSKSYRWKPKAELAAEGSIKADPKSFKDVGSTIFNESNAKLYKFKEGSKYKTYYAISENCAEVVNDVVGQTGIGLLKLNGVITPGTYLEYLNELYEAEDSIVVDRRLYMLDKNGKPYLYPLNPKEPIKLGDLSM